LSTLLLALLPFTLRWTCTAVALLFLCSSLLLGLLILSFLLPLPLLLLLLLPLLLLLLLLSRVPLLPILWLSVQRYRCIIAVFISSSTSPLALLRAVQASSTMLRDRTGDQRILAR
jgi:hypothetical protein